MSKLTVKFEQKNLTVSNANCCSTGISTYVVLDGLEPGHRYYCELSSLAGGSVTFTQNNFYIASSTPGATIPLGFTLKDSRSYIVKFKITDLDYRKSFRYWIPNKNEWYKAAYYGADSEYSAYATQFNQPPAPVLALTNGDGVADDTIELEDPFDAINSANFNKGADWNSLDGNVTTVGSNGGPSYYGTFDQNGNVNEWSDDIATQQKPCLGGSWRDNLLNLTEIKDIPLSRENDNIGFRIACSENDIEDFVFEADDFVLVGDPDNDPNTNGLGGVNYSFYIKKYPVTNSEYVEFLNSEASKLDNYGLYNSNMTTNDRGGIIKTINSSGVSTYSCKPNMNNKPVNFVSWMDAARYCNWLYNLRTNQQNHILNYPYNIAQSNSAPYSGFNYSEDVITIQCGDPSYHKVEFSTETIELAEGLLCNTTNQLIGIIKNAKLGRQYRYEFSALDDNLSNIIPRSGIIIAGNNEQNVNTVYSYGGSLKNLNLKLTVKDLIDDIESSADILLNCKASLPAPTPTPTPTPVPN